ncbi:hypothetical protein [uncultured Roseobacter sp.]|uniref:hypothetical protein n=1 Tax=uncultured Roseobacter sp. TaxID=114847 RepID=UPI00261B1D4B|nr:hypothetical protein [uncultured Roseobacter sp.]
MIGVVLWSDASDRKAVIWCEDQGDLAFLNSADELLQSDAFFDAGDVVQFDMEVQASMRRAHNPRLVLEQAGAGLPDALRQSVSDVATSACTAKIIPFEPRAGRVVAEPLQVSEA